MLMIALLIVSGKKQYEPENTLQKTSVKSFNWTQEKSNQTNQDKYDFLSTYKHSKVAD